MDTYKEKYEKLVGAIKVLRDNNPSDEGIQNWVNDNVPEAAESEDERTRKALIRSFTNQHSNNFPTADGFTREQILTWLEKQGGHTDKIVERAKTEKQRVLITESDGDANIDWNTRSLQDVRKLLERGFQYIDAELKKQGEQKTIDKVKPKFKVGDWVFIEEIKGYKQGAFQIKSVDDFGYNFDEYHIIPFMYEELLSKWTIYDAKDGEVLTSGDCPCIFKSINEENAMFVYCGINAGGDFATKAESKNNIWDDEPENYYPATKEQRDLLFQKMHKAGYEWDAEKKKLNKIELSDVGHEYYSELLKNDKSDTIGDYAYQCAYCMSHDWAIENPTWDNVQSACKLGAKWQKKHDVSAVWSEEDEKMMNSFLHKVEVCNLLTNKESVWIINKLKSLKPQPQQEWSEEDEKKRKRIMHRLSIDGTINNEDLADINEWLKSISPKNRWKPSDDQIDALGKILEYFKRLNAYGKTIDECKSLYEQLKKLREE